VAGLVAFLRERFDELGMAARGGVRGREGGRFNWGKIEDAERFSSSGMRSVVVYIPNNQFMNM
jgi:hypothetical protein